MRKIEVNDFWCIVDPLASSDRTDRSLKKVDSSISLFVIEFAIRLKKENKLTSWLSLQYANSRMLGEQIKIFWKKEKERPDDAEEIKQVDELSNEEIKVDQPQSKSDESIEALNTPNELENRENFCKYFQILYDYALNIGGTSKDCLQILRSLSQDVKELSLEDFSALTTKRGRGKNREKVNYQKVADEFNKKYPEETWDSNQVNNAMIRLRELIIKFWLERDEQGCKNFVEKGETLIPLNHD